MKKLYCIAIDSKHGAVMNIGIQTDSTTPVYIYYNGRDTGKRYKNIGSAARYLEKVLKMWGPDAIPEYSRIDAIPVYGCSEWNKALWRAEHGIISESDLVQVCRAAYGF